MKILVVEDDIDISEALTIALTEEGYEVKALTDGDLVIEEVSKFNPDLIFLDILLSGIDGRRICKELKANPRMNKIPVCMLSAHAEISKTIKAYGADEFVAKPFDIDQILQVVKKYS